MPNIKFIHANGVKILNEKEKQLVNRLLNEYYKKIQRQLKNEVSFEVHIKVHDVSKRQKKFNIHIDVVNSFKFGATADDWDLACAIHKVMDKIMNEIEHKFHVSDQYQKIR